MDQRVASSRLTAGGVIVLCFGATHFILCLVLVQPRKACPNMTEKKCCMGLKDSNQTKQNSHIYSMQMTVVYCRLDPDQLASKKVSDRDPHCFLLWWKIHAYNCNAAGKDEYCYKQY